MEQATQFDVQNVVKIIFELFIIPAIPLVLVMLKTSVNAYVAKKEEEIQDVRIKRIIQQSKDTVFDIVEAVTQAYVDTLKKAGRFDAEAQRDAFEKARKIAEEQISLEARTLIQRTYGDFDSWLESQVEACVRRTKNS